MAAAARRLDLPLWPPVLVTDAALAARLRQEKVDLLLNVHALHIVHPGVLAAPRVGSFNLHPGPLPGYAGLNAPSWAILLGERSHAVTLHWMTAAVDAGPIAYVADVSIRPDDTGLALAARCVSTGLPLLSRLLADAAREPASIPRSRRAQGRPATSARGRPTEGACRGRCPRAGSSTSCARRTTRRFPRRGALRRRGSADARWR